MFIIRERNRKIQEVSKISQEEKIKRLEKQILATAEKTGRVFTMHREAFLFVTGSWAYPAIEMLWRGKTHGSMALAGGVCLCLIDYVCCGKLADKSVLRRCAAGAGIITGVELGLGLVLNRLLGFEIWDYSDVPFNLLGQVCLPYSCLWLGLSLPAMALCQLVRRYEQGRIGNSAEKNVDF